jgi:hypothetical protein
MGFWLGSFYWLCSCVVAFVDVLEPIVLGTCCHDVVLEMSNVLRIVRD